MPRIAIIIITHYPHMLLSPATVHSCERVEAITGRDLRNRKPGPKRKI
jgi:hypothetical protein